LAGSYFGPVLCKPAEAYILATNQSSETAPFWFQQLGSKPFTEKLLEVEAQQTRVFPFSELPAPISTAVALKTREGSPWQLQTFCKGDSKARALGNTVSPWKTFQRPPTTKGAVLSLVNLSQQRNAVEISYYSERHFLGLQKLILEAGFARTDVELSFPEFTESFQVKAQGRWTGLALNERQQELPFSEDTVFLEKLPEARYFLMKARSDQVEESFVVPLTNPKMISESLDQIAHPEKARLFVGKIQKNLEGVNRDLSNAVAAPWSWQAEGLQYADFASITCDGTPSIVEERVDDWIATTGGAICFWNYRVVKELTAQEVQKPSLRSPSSWRPGLAFPRQTR
jgi:hypothetical protein